MAGALVGAAGAGVPLIGAWAGEKGPLVVEAMTTRVRAKDEQGHVGEEERLLVIRTVGKEPDISYSLSNADRQTPLAELTRARGERHWIEQMFQEGKGEAGLDNYEVRSWVGWHHHMTLALLALWFLVTEKGRVGEKRFGGHGSADSTDRYTSAARSAARCPADRRAGNQRPSPQRGGPHLRMA